MSSDDPKLPRYGDLTIVGTTLENLGKVLTRKVNGEWSRAYDVEESWRGRAALGEQPLVFRHERANGLPGALLYLFSRNADVLYVSNVVPTESSQLTESEYNGLIGSFYENLASPAAWEVGAEAQVDLADYDLAERAGVEVRDALAFFSRAANKSTGTGHPLDAQRFDDFVIAVRRLDLSDRPSVDTIVKWLVADGWSDDTAWELGIQYEQGLRLLDRAFSNG